VINWPVRKDLSFLRTSVTGVSFITQPVSRLPLLMYIHTVLYGAVKVLPFFIAITYGKLVLTVSVRWLLATYSSGMFWLPSRFWQQHSSLRLSEKLLNYFKLDKMLISITERNLHLTQDSLTESTITICVISRCMLNRYWKWPLKNFRQAWCVIHLLLGAVWKFLSRNFENWACGIGSGERGGHKND
jgi:hypothetical protein